jgi:Kef-type K+ transport system membrane component KefB
MKITRNIFFYTGVLLLFGGAIYWITKSGAVLQANKIVKAPVQNTSASFTNSFHLFSDFFRTNLTHPLAVLILQIITIIFFARLFGFIFNKIGQPTVIGEIIAGIVLGPSVTGLFFPSVSAFLFPVASLGNIQFLSQVGLILFMFVIGMELDMRIIRKQAQEAVIISHASIIIPYTLGIGLSYFMYTEFAPPHISFIAFALFMGIAMSITAFPVLARVIQERGLTKTRLGAMAITCAAADDVTAWCILAMVIAIVKAGSFLSSLFTIAMAIAYVVLMLLVIRPFLKRLGSIYANREMVSKPVIALLLIILLLSAYTTEVIGIHALFGAFLAGVIMPPDLNFRKIVVEKLEDVSVVLLLPLFFVFTGLRTQIGLLTNAHLWGTCGWVVLVAVVGKFGGSSIAAKVVGQSWKESLSIGALMNTRGLMELIVLNIGYDLGILSPQVFAMMVLMALITTFMTGPALDLINWLMPDKKRAAIAIPVTQKVSEILLSFGSAQSGRKLLRLAYQMMGKQQLNNNTSAINITYNADINPWQVNEFEKETFRYIRAEAKRYNLKINTSYLPSKDVEKEIVKITGSGQYDFMFIDAGKSLFKGTIVGNIMEAGKLLYPKNIANILKGNKKISPRMLQANDMMDDRARSFITGASCNIGIFIDKDFYEADKIFMPVFSNTDEVLLQYAIQFVSQHNADVTVLDTTNHTGNTNLLKEKIQQFNREFKKTIQINNNRTIDKNMLNRFDLMVISYESWEKLVQSKSIWMDYIPSTLIIKNNKQEEVNDAVLIASNTEQL